MVYYNFNKLSSLKDGDVLFFDELPNSNPAVQNSLLTLIEDRVMISGDKLPDIMIVAAGNYQGMTPMTPQVKRRFVWYDVKFDRSMWSRYMNHTYQMPEEISIKLSQLIKNEDFTGYNFNTSADLDKAVEMIIFDVPTPYQKDVKPILDTLIDNPLKEDIVKNGEIVWGKDEKIGWLKFKQLQLNIELFKNEPKETNSNNEILILNENKEIIGEIKNVENLKLIYNFSGEKLNDLNNGVVVSPLTPRLGPIFFKKPNN